MLKLPYQKLRSSHEGGLNTNSLCLATARYSKKILHSIPVLSIFVLLGIMGFSTMGLPLAEPDGEAYAETLNTNTSLIIDNGTATDSTATVRNGVTYSSHTVQVKADNITGYTLSITGPTNLSNGGTTINGAGGKQGSAMTDNTWGYGWNTTSTADANMTYNSFTGSAQTLSGDSVSNNSVNFTRKLVFAAKFNQNATEGHYRANVTLNLTVTPKTVTTYNYSVTYNLNGGSGTAPVQQANSDSSSYTFYAANGSSLSKTGYELVGWDTSSSASTIVYKPGAPIKLTSSNNTRSIYAVWKANAWNTITTMQEMTADICKNATNIPKTLKDSRDQKSYTVQKLSDGNCWMTSNLTLDLTKAGVATVAESDNLSSDYPASALPNRFDTANTNAWTDTQTLDEFSKAPQKVNSGSSKGDGNGYQTLYGYYYSWCAATAGTCSTASSYNSVDTSGSICPKGWKLPKGGIVIATNIATYQTGNDFANIMKADGANITSLSTTTYTPWSNKLDAGPPAYFALGGANWYRAGYVYSDGLFEPGSSAGYWSRTSNNPTSAYRLLLGGDKYLYPASTHNRYVGLPVRCIAYSS